MSLSELGAYLQRQREEQNLSLTTVEEVTHIRRVHLEAIEAGHWDSLPPGVFVRGLLKSYAKVLNLNPETVQRMYFKERPKEGPSEAREVLSQPLLREPRLSMESVLTLVFIGAAAVIGWWLWQTFVGPMLSTPPGGTPTAVVGTAGPRATATRPLVAGTATRPIPTAVMAIPLASVTPEGAGPASMTPSAVAAESTSAAPGATSSGSQVATATIAATSARATATPARATATVPRPTATSPLSPTAPRTSLTPGKGTPTAVASAAPAGGLRITVRSAGSVWLRVLVDGVGKAAFEGFLKKGENERWEGQARTSITLRTGNAGDTEVSLNGQRLPALGKTGEVKTVEWRLLPDGRVQQTP